MRKILSLLTLLAGSVTAHTSFNANSTQGTAFVTLAQGDMHFDLRVHSIVLPGSKQTLAYFEGFDIAIDNGGNVYLEDNVDTFVAVNSYVQTTIPKGATDILIRAQRCTKSDTVCTWVGGPYLQIEVWDISSSGYASAISKITTVNPASNAFAIFGNTGLNAKLAYARWCGGTTPMQTYLSTSVIAPYPNGNIAPASCGTVVGDWEFEASSGVDSGPNGYTITSFGAATFSSSPTPAPGCILPTQSFSTTKTAQLFSTPCQSTQDTPTLTLAWSYLGIGADGVTQTPTFSSVSAANPTVTGLIRGSFNVQLIVTDTASQSTTVTVHDGVIVGDPGDNVQSTGNATIDKLYMPLVQWGKNPYPYFDNQNKALADYFGTAQSSSFDPTVAQTGTVTCTNGSTTCTFSGVDPSTIFCPIDGTHPDAHISFVPWYNSGLARDMYTVSACTSTTLSLVSNYVGPTATSSGIQWSAGASFYPLWDINVSGATITCSNGSPTCTVAGVNAKNVWCAGGTTTDGATGAVIWDSDGTTTYRSLYQVSGCPTTASLTLTNNYRGTVTTASAVNVSAWGNNDAGYWVGISNNPNYYDNAMGFYSLYFRSGIDTYYTYGTTMAVRWWKMPYNNQGISCTQIGGDACIVSVSARDATVGMTTAYLLGQNSNYLTGSRLYWQAYDRLFFPVTFPLFDLRVQSIHLERLAQWIMIDATNQATNLSSMYGSVASWKSIQGTGAGVTGDGALINQSGGGGPASNQGGPGTVTMTPGSTAVAGAGTNFSSNLGPYFASATTTTGQTCTGGDGFDTSAYYLPNIHSGTSLDLPSNYTGSHSGAGFGWQMNNLIGCGIQPFMMAYFMHSMYLAYQSLQGHDSSSGACASVIACASSTILASMRWMTNYGYMDVTSPPATPNLVVHGFNYARGFVESEPNPFSDQNNWCLAPTPNCPNDYNSLVGARTLGTESAAGIAAAKTLGDAGTTGAAVYAAMYGGLGGTNADANFIGPFIGWPGTDSAGTDFSGGYQLKAKDFGFAFGWGNGAMWPAVAGPVNGTAGSVRGTGVGSSSTIRN